MRNMWYNLRRMLRGVIIMDLKEAMKKRHMVRKYTDKPLSDELIRKIMGIVKDELMF